METTGITLLRPVFRGGCLDLRDESGKLVKILDKKVSDVK